MATKQDLINRWDTFLQKIETRFNESLGHAEEACLEQLKETDYDYYTVVRTWSGIQTQLHNLIQKIYETWQNNVRLKMEELGDSWYWNQADKQNELSEKLQNKLSDFEIEIQGKLAKQFYDHAIQIANQDFNCSQCNAKIEIVKDLFRAQYITCQYCQTVNTFEPETKFMQVGYGVIDDIVKLELYPLQKEIDKAHSKFNNIRRPIKDWDLANQLWQNYKDTFFNYHEAFFKRCIEFSSDRQKRYDEDIQRKELEFKEQEKNYFR